MDSDCLSLTYSEKVWMEVRIPSYKTGAQIKRKAQSCEVQGTSVSLLSCKLYSGLKQEFQRLPRQNPVLEVTNYTLDSIS